MGNYHTCGPNEAIVVSGGCGRGNKKRYVVGGVVFAWWLVTDLQRLSLEVITVHPCCVDGETAQGVACTVSTVAQCKVMSEIEFLKIAAEQFLGKKKETIQNNIRNTLEGHLRAILGTLTIEEIYKDREMFSRKICKIAAPDVARMGIAILSFTIKDIKDSVSYLSALGKAQAALVKRDAAVGVANAERDAGIREAECQKQALDVVYEMNAKIENNHRLYDLAKAQYDTEVNAAKAQAALAYELQVAKIRQQIRKEEVEINIIERKKEAEVEDKEVERIEKELFASVKLPAEAEGYRIKTVAEGNKKKVTEEGKGESSKKKLEGSSEAYVIEKIGNAEAESMTLKAKVFKTYGNAAKTKLVLESLPQITRKVCLPLQNINEILVVGGSDGVTTDVNRLLAQIPPSVSAINDAFGKMLNKNLNHFIVIIYYIFNGWNVSPNKVN